MEPISTTKDTLIAQKTRCAFCNDTNIHRFLEQTTNDLIKFECVACGIDFYISNYDGSSYGASQSTSPEAFWVPYGKTIQHAGYTIPGGLIYFGSDLQCIKYRHSSSEPSLIDPKLPIGKLDSFEYHKYNGDRFCKRSFRGDWLNYCHLSTTYRTAYLEWLSTGKDDPAVNIFFVFIYFFGLERRVLDDAKYMTEARNDFPLICKEVKRLLSIYGEDLNFYGCANNLLDLLHVVQTQGPFYCKPSQAEPYSKEIPLSLKMALGQLAIDSISLTAELAEIWAVNSLEMQQRKRPTKSCRDTYCDLFKIRFTQQFRNGMMLAPSNLKLQAIYNPVSTSFGGPVEIQIPDLPDVTRTSESSSIICDIAIACSDELESYSRYLGRNPNQKKSLEAISYLPHSLVKLHAEKEFPNLTKLLNDQLFSGSLVFLSLSSLLQQIPTIKLDGFGKKETTIMANLFGKLNIGIEPDPRFGNFILKPEQDVVLFRISEEAPIAPSTEYSAATVVIHLAAAVAHADGAVDTAEKNHLEQHIETILHLTADEQMRLRAHTQWLLSSFPGMDGVNKRIASLKQSERESLGTFLVGIAQADGYIHPAEVAILCKIYEMLGLNTQSLYSHAHTAALTPVTVQITDVAKSQGYAIPPPPQKPVEGFSLDMSTIETKLAETASVSAILNNIFKEDETIQPSASKQTKSATTIPISGLDLEAFTFMQLLASKLVWERDELEKLAADHNLMLDGTLDSINDASFDHFGGPFFEGDESIEINSEFAKELSV